MKLRNAFLLHLPEFKQHPYFNGIDWDKVTNRESNPPFEPIEFKFSGNPLNKTVLFNTTLDAATGASGAALAEQYNGKIYVKQSKQSHSLHSMFFRLDVLISIFFFSNFIHRLFIHCPRASTIKLTLCSQMSYK